MLFTHCVILIHFHHIIYFTDFHLSTSTKKKLWTVEMTVYRSWQPALKCGPRWCKEPSSWTQTGGRYAGSLMESVSFYITWNEAFKKKEAATAFTSSSLCSFRTSLNFLSFLYPVFLNSQIVNLKIKGFEKSKGAYTRLDTNNSIWQRENPVNHSLSKR